MKILNFYFIRHGQTEWNLQNRLQGSQNSQLTEKGIDDARLTGHYLSNIEFNSAYSSPQPRAIETLHHILSHFANKDKIRVNILEDLTEMDYGNWEGLLIDELKKTSEFNIFLNDAVKFSGLINHGENYGDVFKRSTKSMESIITNSKENENILIVTHGNFLRLLLCHLDGKDWQKHRDDSYFPKISNASISIVKCEINTVTAEKKFSLASLNSVEHLI